MASKNKKPQYLDLRFKSYAKFDLWVKETRSKSIHFIDKGQDLMKMVIADNNEVIITELNNKVWLGKFVNPDHLTPGMKIELWDNDNSEYIPFEFTISRVQDHKKKS